ncbi:MAG: efflux RND transporter periplasmic adaptor subunit [Myxococcota bacterium]
MNPKSSSLVALGVVAGAVLATGVGLFTQRQLGAEPGRPEVGPKRVEVATVDRVESEKQLKLSGVVRAKQSAELAFTVGGRMTARSVDLGDRVRRGQVLARLDSRPFRNQLAATDAALAEVNARIAQAERDVSRAQALNDAKAVGAEELEKIENGLAVAQAKRQSLLAQRAEHARLLEESALRAPFDGTVVSVHAEAGEYANPARPVLAVSGSGELELEIEVPELYREAVAEGDEVEVELPLSSITQSKGRVLAVGAAARGPGQLFPVRIALAEEVPAGASATVVVPVKIPARAMVPVAAVANPGGQRPFVFRVNSTRAERVFVEVRDLLGESVSIEGELESGDAVVVAGHASLLDGDEVEVAR